jgi:hypothetical protein
LTIRYYNNTMTQLSLHTSYYFSNKYCVVCLGHNAFQQIDENVLVHSGWVGALGW